MSNIVPTDKRRLRACLLCGIVKSSSDFQKSGCPNDSDLLENAVGKRPSSERYTSASFSGMVGLMKPNGSWVAKWQGNDKCVEGIYAIRVHGKISEQLADDLEAAGYKYRPRDGSVRD
ncbi:transcription elongation factor spt4 [Rhizophlyctis rosea]|nr:transcription elongation factor spt4 [Rhizophlyctis rosea]